MTKLFLIASVAALAIAAPAAAERGGKGGGQRAERAEVERGGGKAARAERQARVERQGGGERRAARVERRGGGEQRAARVERRGGGERRLAQAERREQRPARVERPDRREQRVARVERQDRREQRAQGPVRDNRREARVQRVEREDRREQRAARIQREDRRDLQAQRVERQDRREPRAQRVDRADRDFVRFDGPALRQQQIANRINLQELRERRFANRLERRAQRNELRAERIAAARILWDNDNIFRFRDFDDDNWYGPVRTRLIIDGCPPGHVNWDDFCIPPGQFRKLMIGQALPPIYASSYVPLGLRSLYYDTDDYYYRYGDGYLYRVDRGTNLIAALLPLLGGGLGIGQLFPSQYMNSYVPSYYRPFYLDTDDDYYRYANGYIYEIDGDNGYIEDIIPAYGYGYGVGQMMPASYSYYNVPYQYRDWYYDTPDYSYRYAPGAIYQVDRDTSLITAIAALLTPGFAVGQPLPMGYDAYNVPYSYRTQYYDTPTAWYRYNNGYIYQVDPTTRLITAVIDAIV